MKNLKQLVCMLLVAVMLTGMFPAEAVDPHGGAPLVSVYTDSSGSAQFNNWTAQPRAASTGEYTYNDWVSTLSANWNPHTYATDAQAYPIDYLTSGLYRFVFNDALNPVEGRNPYEGYVIVPEMAASLPVDVTEKVKAEGKFDIPDSATSGYAYTIDLNPLATWEDGTKITADDYVESMKRLLDPKLQNYRADGYYDGSFSIAGAEMYANAGLVSPVSVASAMEKDGLADLEAFLTAYGEAEAYINWNYSFGGAYDFAAGEWGEWGDAANEIVATGKTVNEFMPFFLESAQYMNGADAATADEWFYNEVYVTWTYPDNVSYDTVGLYKSGDYQITLVLDQYLVGFNLLYELTGSWLVKTDLYDECLTETADGWTSTYCTSAETTCSYGPYRMSSYTPDTSMHFVKNENWFGYTDGKHVYVDPVDGLTYAMYMTTEIDCQVVANVATAKQMFLQGELMEYGLQTEDFNTYRSSPFCYFTPGQATYFLLLNGNMNAIKEREATADFDHIAYDLETLTLTSFHRAMGLAYDRDAYCAAISPADSGALGLIGHAYISDPLTGERYRDTESAKLALCEVYGVDPDDFASLDEAVASITGYDPVAAKEWFNKAYTEALELGYITDADGDGKCDQTIRLTYSAASAPSFFKNLTGNLDYLTEKANEVTAGTPFEGKIEFVASDPLGNAWSDNIKAGRTDTVLAGWSGSAMDPYGLIEVYTNPDYQYDATWFDAAEVDMTMTIDDKSITMNLSEWTQALNGEEVNGYNFGDGMISNDVRVEILAGIEKAILLEYNYLPFIEDGSMALLSQKVYYIIDEYNPVMGRGGLAYLRYHYTDDEWAAYVESCGGELDYTTTVPDTGFSDVPASAYYAEAVKWAAENHVTSGTTATTFSPNSNVTRAQAVTFLWRAKGSPEPKTQESQFTDVQDTSSWYYKAVMWAMENNITSGTTATTFSPDGNVTRGQMMTFLYRTMGEPGKTGTGAWYADAENWATQNDLLNGTAVAYSTNGDCPRSDVVYYLWKALAG